MSMERIDYQPIADFRTALRRFLSTSETVVRRHGLTPARYDLLVMVEAAGGEGTTINALAERLALAPNSVTELVNRAEAAGLVRRHADPADGRVTRVSATPLGRERIAAAVSALAPQRTHLLNLLAAVRARLQARPTDAPKP
jgi:DNA-binding MarR family transcriptional regulator